MKKVKSLILLMVTAIGFISCNNNMTTKLSADDTKVVSERFSNIGKAHNEMLKDFYFGNHYSRNVNSSYRDLSVEDYFGVIDKQYIIINYGKNIARSADDNYQTASSILQEEISVSELSCKYISQIENILMTPGASLEETQDSISAIEVNALKDNEEDSIYEFLSYAETAKASLEFWNDNIDVLEENFEKDSSRGAIKNLWNKYKHKLGMMAASDAAGAAAGAIEGAIIGSQIPGVGTAVGAAIGATVAGAASSAEGFKRDCLCIIVPITDIKKKVENH